MKAMNPRLTHEYGKGWVFSVELDGEAVGQAKTIVDGYPTGYFDIQVEKWSEKRSLQANAYFHVLANLIAKETKSSMDDVKRMLVLQYGTPARGKDGKYAAVKVPKNTNIEDFYPYYKHIGTDENGLDMYIFFKRTSELNKDEMSRLIDGTVDEAKALNIETLPPDELARMMNRYKEGA
jgi:hypothetical protein